MGHSGYRVREKSQSIAVAEVRNYGVVVEEMMDKVWRWDIF